MPAFEKVVLHQAQAMFTEHGPEAGAQLLQKHNLVELAIDYAIDHNNFNHAFELANHSAPNKLPDIHLKKALALEDDEQYKQAGEEFIRAGKPKEAIDMYLHQRDWESAMSIAENYDRDAIPEVLTSQARDLVDHKNDLHAAEELFLRARKPELAVQMYTQKKMINEAVRICKKHCPRLLSDVLDAYGSLQGSSQTMEDICEAARVYEETGNFSRAVDAYLQINEQLCSDESKLEKVWMQAVNTAQRHCHDRYPDVVVICAKRLSILGRHCAAGELFESVDKVREAVQAYIAGEVWDRARNLAKHTCPELQPKIEEAFNQDLVRKGEGDELIRRGNVQTALDMYAKNAEWYKCLQLAERSLPKVLPHYLVQHA